MRRFVTIVTGRTLAVLTKQVNNNLPKWQVAPGFESRVREAFEGATLAEIAEKTGENYYTLGNYLKLKRKATPQFFVAVAELTNYSLNWLLTAKGPKLIPGKEPPLKSRVDDPQLSRELKQVIRDEIIEVMGILLSSKKLTKPMLQRSMEELDEKMRR